MVMAMGPQTNKCNNVINLKHNIFWRADFKKTVSSDQTFKMEIDQPFYSEPFGEIQEAKLLLSINHILVTKNTNIYNISSGWWFQPIWKILVKLEIIPKDPGEHQALQ